MSPLATVISWPVLSLLPPIQRLENVAVRLVFAGFILLTVGLAAGRHLPRPADAAYWSDPKVVWSICLWVVYLALLVLRRMRVPSSRGLAISFIAAFVFLLLTFWAGSSQAIWHMGTGVTIPSYSKTRPRQRSITPNLHVIGRFRRRVPGKLELALI